MKDKVYSWRLNEDLKLALEDAARRENKSVSSLLEGIVSDWLSGHSANDDDQQIQQQLQKSALECAGSIREADRDLAERASSRIQEKLKRKHAS
jgi:translation initiation factor 2B subunit (eIF-2B alpha/beta/delta family)